MPKTFSRHLEALALAALRGHRGLATGAVLRPSARKAARKEQRRRQCQARLREHAVECIADVLGGDQL